MPVLQVVDISGNDGQRIIAWMMVRVGGRLYVEWGEKEHEPTVMVICVIYSLWALM